MWRRATPPPARLDNLILCSLSPVSQLHTCRRSVPGRLAAMSESSSAASPSARAEGRGGVAGLPASIDRWSVLVARFLCLVRT